MKQSQQNKLVIGLLGGVGAGKSTVAAEMAKLGCAVIDADAIGHELLGDPAVQAELRQRWGDEIFAAGGEVNRAVVAEIAFNDESELAALNAIMHPRIRQRLVERVAAAQADPAVRAVVLDAAVMLEAGWDNLCTQLVFVDAPADVRRTRAAGKGWSAGQWQRRENSQIPIDKKKNACYHTLSNHSGVPQLREHVRELLDQLAPISDRS